MLWFFRLSGHYICAATCDGMAPQGDLRTATVTYIRWERVAAVSRGLQTFTHVIFVLLKRDKVIFGMTVLQTILTIFFDYLFASELPGSFRFGVLGLAISATCTYTLLFLLALRYLPKLFVPPFNWTWLMKWWCGGRWAGLAGFLAEP